MGGRKNSGWSVSVSICSISCANISSPLALPLGELSPKVTERAFRTHFPSPSSLRSATSPKGRGKGCSYKNRHSRDNPTVPVKCLMRPAHCKAALFCETQCAHIFLARRKNGLVQPNRNLSTANNNRIQLVKLYRFPEHRFGSCLKRSLFPTD